MAEISIIVPVYQVEKYIRQCIDSILAQTFTDFELILVDDGSKDNSGKICDEYAEKDKRIRVIHKENGGLSDARNKGLDNASGNYFMFVDGDDYIAPNMAECLYKKIFEAKADIAVCNYRYIFESDGEKDFATENKAEVLNSNEIFYNRKNERNYGFWTVAWNKLYKREKICDTDSEDEGSDTEKEVPWVILPDNPYKRLWDLIISCIILYSSIMTPYELAFMDKTKDSWSDFFLDVFLWLDIIINFFSAYTDSEENLVKNHKKIVLTYLKTWFIVDVQGEFLAKPFVVQN